MTTLALMSWYGVNRYEILVDIVTHRKYYNFKLNEGKTIENLLERSERLYQDLTQL